MTNLDIDDFHDGRKIQNYVIIGMIVMVIIMLAAAWVGTKFNL